MLKTQKLLLLRLLPPAVPVPVPSLFCHSRPRLFVTSTYTTRNHATQQQRFPLCLAAKLPAESQHQTLLLSAETKMPGAVSRLCNVSGYTTELLEVRADDPKLRVLFIPGNPGVVAFYKDFLESLYDQLGGTASITAIAHTSHTQKDWANGRLFSMEEQIDHKVDFIKKELQDSEVPLVLVGHSIGGYIAIETLRKSQEKVAFCIALYPFLMMNPQSKLQLIIQIISASVIISTAFCLLIASTKWLPKRVQRSILLKIFGRSLSELAIQAACIYLPQYHLFRNVLFMAKTEFRKLVETPDWTFMRNNQGKLAFLYGLGDHWAPLEMHDEIAKQLPGAPLAVEREGHTHNFSCTAAGSVWVARHVASLVKSKLSSSGQPVHGRYYVTELLEVRADDPELHVVLIPGNPGFIRSYKDFVESLCEQLRGIVSITAVGYTSQTKMDWESGRLFSLKEHISHKVDFIKLKTPTIIKFTHEPWSNSAMSL